MTTDAALDIETDASGLDLADQKPQDSRRDGTDPRVPVARLERLPVIEPDHMPVQCLSDATEDTVEVREHNHLSAVVHRLSRDLGASRASLADPPTSPAAYAAWRIAMKFPDATASR